MPNGHDKNWIRLCAAVDGFRARFDAWPKRVRAFRECIADLRERVFTHESYEQLISKIELIPDDEASMVAEDDCGQSYDYGKEGFPDPRPEDRAADWLGVKPDRYV